MEVTLIKYIAVTVKAPSADVRGGPLKVSKALHNDNALAPPVRET